MRNPSPCSVRAARPASTIGPIRRPARRDEDAELVTAQAVGAAAGLDGRGQVRSQPAKQAVARRVAVAVVVELEAVQVVEGEDVAVLRVPGPSSSADSRSSISLRRLPSSVSESVTASSWSAAIRPVFSRKLIPIRTITATSVATESQIETSCRRLK